MVGITGRMTLSAGSGAVRIAFVTPVGCSISAIRRMASKTGSFQRKPASASVCRSRRWLGR